MLVVPLVFQVINRSWALVGTTDVIWKVPAAGVYNSALARVLPLLPLPPAASTLPWGSNVAVGGPRGVVIEPVDAHVPPAGSYSSALERMPALKLLVAPPATSTIPLGSNVAV